MANRAQRRGAQKNGIAQALQGLASQMPKRDDDDEGEDLNKLPKPDQQVIGPDQIEWTWICGASYLVKGVLTTADSSYKVFAHRMADRPDDPMQTHVFEMFGEEAKVLGQALVSAWNWRDIWQLHAGGFIAKELGIVAPVEDDDDD